jgi:hypothetical protein
MLPSGSARLLNIQAKNVPLQSDVVDGRNFLLTSYNNG